MAGRYESLWKTNIEQIVASSPIVLRAHALVKDTVSGEVFAQLKLQNTSNKSISALFVALRCTTVDNVDTVGFDDCAYLDLNDYGNRTFGEKQLVPLPDSRTRAYSVSLKKIVFSDGSTAEYQTYIRFVSVAQMKPLSALGEFEAQYRRETTVNMQQALPDQQDGCWRCGCGQVNTDIDAPCIVCGADLQQQLEKLNRQHLESSLNSYNNNLQKQVEASNKKKKRQKMLVVAALCCAILLAISGVIVFAVNNHLENERLEQAAFEAAEKERSEYEATHSLEREFEPGDTIQLGEVSYLTQQTGTRATRDFEWTVLAKEDNRIFVICNEAVDFYSYNPFSYGVIDNSWEQSQIREWLNTSLLGGFSSDIQDRITETENENSHYEKYYYYGKPNDEYMPIDFGNATIIDPTTIDSVFLLSVDEYNYYKDIIDMPGNTEDKYWLRTPSLHFWRDPARWSRDRDDSIPTTQAHDLGSYDGKLGVIWGHTATTSEERHGIQPVMWIKTSD